MFSGTTLITGSSGFIGKRFQTTLKNSSETRIVTLDEHEIFGSVNWQRFLVNFLSEISPSQIFHIGGCANTLEQDVQYMMERNFESTRILANWCNSNNSKLVYSSSAACYGVNGLVPSNLYGWSKFCAEKVVSALGGISLRYFNVYGPGEEHKGQMSSVFYQAYLARSNKKKFALFPGSPKRDFVYVDDVVQANLVAMASHSLLTGSIFDVGTAQPKTFEEGLGIMKIPFEYLPSTKVPDGYQNYTSAKMELWPPGWRPEHSLESGLNLYMKYLGYQS
jgi:ADP-L-glycero-D-manno-heptose 6-epimerase